MNYNFIIGLILLVLSVLIGVEAGKKFTQKRIFYADFNEFNQLLISEMLCFKTTLPQIIENNLRQNSCFYSALNEKYVNRIDKKHNFSFLSEKENVFFNEYINKIGKNNSSSDTEYLKSVKDRINSCLISANLDEEKKKPLYIKLSFMIGLICLVVSL